MSGESLTPEQWLLAEDRGCLEQRATRLAWVAAEAPSAEIWIFPGGWLGQHLFEEARYCFVYGQFLASTVLGFAYIERTLAAMFYGAGRNDLQRATSGKLLKEALAAGWIDERELEVFEKARRLRNPLIHFRKPLHNELPESRAVTEERHPYEVVESDAKHILEVMFRLVERNAVG
jgi:hypothetical protein